MKGKVLIGLSKDNDEAPAFLPFNFNSEKLPDKIAECFNRNRPPQFLYDVTDNLESRKIRVFPEKNQLSEGRQYLWVEDKYHWQDKTLVQNALFCSNAAYHKNPLEYLNDKRKYHGVILLIAANVKFGKQIASLFIASTGFTKTEKMLIVAFRGTSTKEDIESDLQIGMKTDDSFVGHVHGGFLKRMKSVPVDKILGLAFINKVDFVVTCGHSLGGAVSSLVHIKLQDELKRRNQQNELNSLSSNNLINITFGAPMLGNTHFAKYLSGDNYTKNVFNFVSGKDFVPPLLSIGYSIPCVKAKYRGNWKYLLRFALNFPEACYCLCLKGLNISVELTMLESAMKALRAQKSTLQNEFQKLNYVPIGKYVHIQEVEKKVSIKHLHTDAKIVECVLQTSLNFGCDNPSEIAEGHSLDSYLDLIKSAYGGFNTFKSSNRKILIEKKQFGDDFMGEDGLGYRFDSVCRFTCITCEEAQPVYVDAQPVAFCHKCKNEPKALEHVCHKENCEDIHNTEHRHTSETVDWESSDDSPIKELFSSSGRINWLKRKIGLSTEDEQKADVIVDALQLLEVQLPNSRFQEIREDDIAKCFRRKALQFHPNIRMQLRASNWITNKRKKEYEQAKRVVEFAQNILVSYCRNPTILSNSVVEIVNRKLEQNLVEISLPPPMKIIKLASFPSKVTEIPEIDKKIENLRKEAAFKNEANMK